MTIKQTIIAAIQESWAGSEVPDPYGPHSLESEYSRGQFELAVQLLGYDGQNGEMSDAVRALWKEASATEDKWFNSEPVQQAIRAARIAWEGEHGTLDSQVELVAAARALMEMVIATAGLPLSVDSLTSRERVYAAILGGAASIEEWEAAR